MKKNKKTLIISIIILIIILIPLYIFLNKTTQKKDEDKANINVFCNQTEENVVCSIRLENNTENPVEWKQITSTYELENLEYINTIDTGGAYLQSGNKITVTTAESIVLKPKENEIVSSSTLYDLVTKMKLINGNKIKVTIKEIIIKTEDGNEYKIKDYVHEEEIQANYKYEYDEKNNKFVFYERYDKYNKISEYTCKSKKCYTHIDGYFSYVDVLRGKIIILDGEELVFFDFKKDLPLATYGKQINILFDEKNEQKYFYVMDIKTKKYGIIDLDGNIIKDFVLEELDKNKDFKLLLNTYSVENDLLVVKESGKYGISRITTNEKITEIKYDDVRLYNNKYYKAKTDDKWYLYSYNKKEKVIEEGYDELLFVTNDIIAAEIDGYLYIKDYKGNNLTEDKVKTHIPYNEYACCATPKGISIFENIETKMIDIYIDKQVGEKQTDYKTYKYVYDKNKKEIKESEI